MPPLDPYYQDTPISVFTPAEYEGPLNPASWEPTMLDPTRYYTMNPGGRFPGDLWIYTEFLRMMGGIERQVTRTGGEREGEGGGGPLSQVRRLGRWLLNLWRQSPGTAAPIMRQFVERFGAFTTPTNPYESTPSIFSGPGQFYGPSGGFAGGILDQGRITRGEGGGIAGFSDQPFGPDVTGGGGNPFAGRAQLPAWQGQSFDPQFLAWQPERPLSEPAEFVSAYGERGPATISGPMQQGPPMGGLAGGQGSGFGAGGFGAPQPGSLEELFMQLFPEVAAGQQEFQPQDLQALLTQIFGNEGRMAEILRQALGGMENVSPTSLDVGGPDWGGVLFEPENWTYLGADIAGHRFYNPSTGQEVTMPREYESGLPSLFTRSDFGGGGGLYPGAPWYLY